MPYETKGCVFVRKEKLMLHLRPTSYFGSEVSRIRLSQKAFINLLE